MCCYGQVLYAGRPSSRRGLGGYEKDGKNRELAFAIGFERSITGEPVAAIIDGAEDVREIVVPPFSVSLATGVENKGRKLTRRLPGTSVAGRWGAFPRSRFRSCAWRFMRCAMKKKIPVSVSINEAVELAKAYGDVEDAPFVNGVLSSIAKEIASEDA